MAERKPKIELTWKQCEMVASYYRFPTAVLLFNEDVMRKRLKGHRKDKVPMAELRKQLASTEKEILRITNECHNEKIRADNLQLRVKEVMDENAGWGTRAVDWDIAIHKKEKELNLALEALDHATAKNKELEATTGCRMYFKNRCNAGEAYSAESKRLKKENAALKVELKREKEGETLLCPMEIENKCSLVKRNAALTKENAILVSRNKELIRSRRVRKGNHSGSVSRVIRERRKRLGG